MDEKEIYDEFHEFSKRINDEKIKKYEKTINYKEFLDNAKLNKNLLLDLINKCKYGFDIEISRVLINYVPKLDYIYKLTFTVFVLSGEIPNFKLLGFKAENTELIKAMYKLYNHFYETPYGTYRDLPELLDDVEHLYKPQINTDTLNWLRVIIKREQDDGINMSDGQINPLLIKSKLDNIFLKCKEELYWYFTDEEIISLEIIYNKSQAVVLDKTKAIISFEDNRDKTFSKENSQDISQIIKTALEKSKKIKDSEEENRRLISNNLTNKQCSSNIEVKDKFINNEKKNNIVDDSKLKKGMVVKNYKDMCKLLGQKEKSGKSKILQLINWKRYFLFEQQGHKFIIKDIYDTPIEKVDKRGGNHSKYINEIEPSILNMLYKNNNVIILRLNNIMEEIGLVNMNYIVGNKNKAKLAEILDINEKIINHFYDITYSKLQSIIETALNRLEKKN